MNIKYKVALLSAIISAPLLNPYNQAHAEVDSNWYRQSAISPDGSTILFAAKGDIYTVPVSGGNATPIVSDTGWDGYPVWSSDGKQIAFASDRNGSLDVYLMPLNNPVPTRLTFHSANDYPTDFTNNGNEVIFSSGRVPSSQSSGFPTTAVNQLYSVSVNGGTPTQMLTTAAMEARFSPNGKLLTYMDNKSYENNFRKHDMSSFSRDIWTYDIKRNKHTKLTTFEGGDSTPVWSPNGDEIYFLSEQHANNFNVWKMSSQGSDLEQVSNFNTHPVRDLSISNEGLLAYSWHGNIYTQSANSAPKRLKINLIAAKVNLDEESESIAGKAENFEMSPSGKETAFIARGELFVSSVEYGTTVRLSNTAEQERSISWFPDNRSIAYSAEKDGVWGIYRVSIVDNNEPYFFAATKFKTETLLKGDVDMFQAMVSPDGNQIAYLYQRDEIRVYNIETKKSTTVFAAKYNYSYSDGDISFDWSPDSKYIVASYVPRGFLFMPEIGIAPADGSKAPVDVTLSGYGEFAPNWVSNEMIVFGSDRYGERAHGSWGVEMDVMALFLTQQAFDDYNMSKEEKELFAEAEKAKEEDEKDDEDENSEDEEEAVENVEIDWANLDERTVRLTRHSSDLSSFAVTPNMDKLYYLARFEKGYDLWVEDFTEHSTKLALKLNASGASFNISDDGETAILLADGQLAKLTLGDTVKKDAIAVNGAVAVKSDAEREYLFKHIWRQTKDKFYNPNMHGIDWDAMYAEYLPKVKGINNNRDFATLGSELLGELNASHTGTYYRSPVPSQSNTATLGLLFASEPGKKGLTVEEILPFSPLLKYKDKVKVGSVLSAIDGKLISAKQNVHKQLNGKAGKRTRLSFENGRKTTEVVIRPQSFRDELNALYKRWVDSRREYVNELSNGRLAYVHIPQMDDSAYRDVHKELFGRGYDKEGVVVDTRFNRGGWLTDDLVTLLSGKHYSWLSARGEKFKGNSMARWTKPSILVVNEGNYSDGYCFPNGYRTNKIGKIVGMPVPGTCTAVWWEGLQTGDLTFGIPQLGVLNNDGTFMENDQLIPDITVENTKEATAKGEDAQLKRAVEELLK
ncbi:S41 family peptidase [Glaciecola sp. 2405UD65-10]|uniref:S41 family peptidase n=1 Tax=Glaciecola sp. 2405UD65-10 TaxID=3397244 RepID=UPI003B59EE52